MVMVTFFSTVLSQSKIQVLLITKVNTVLFLLVNMSSVLPLKFFKLIYKARLLLTQWTL